MMWNVIGGCYMSCLNINVAGVSTYCMKKMWYVTNSINEVVFLLTAVG